VNADWHSDDLSERVFCSYCVEFQEEDFGGRFADDRTHHDGLVYCAGATNEEYCTITQNGFKVWLTTKYKDTCVPLMVSLTGLHPEVIIPTQTEYTIHIRDISNSPRIFFQVLNRQIGKRSFHSTSSNDLRLKFEDIFLCGIQKFA